MSALVLIGIWLGGAFLVMFAWSALVPYNSFLYAHEDEFFLRAFWALIWPCLVFLGVVLGPLWLLFKAAEWAGSKVGKRS